MITAKIEVFAKPNATYEVEPEQRLSILADATTDVMFQKQLKYSWYWYREIENKDGTKEISEYSTVIHGLVHCIVTNCLHTFLVMVLLI